MKATATTTRTSQPVSADPARRPALPAWLKQGRLFRAVGMIMAVGLIGNVIYIGSQETWSAGDILASLRPEYFLLALVMSLVPLFTHATRIVMWSRVFRKPLTFSRAFTAVMFNELGSAMTPTAVGGGYAKLYYLYRSGFSTAQATLTMILGSVEDFAFVMTVVGAAFYLSASGDNPSLRIAADNVLHQAPYLFLLIGAVGAGYLIYRRLRRNELPAVSERDVVTGEAKKPWRERFRAFRHDFFGAVGFAVRYGRTTLLLNTGLSWIGWVCRYGAINAVLAGFGLPVDQLLFPVLNWSVFTVNNFVATPGGMGGAETAFILVMGSFIPAGLQSLVTLVWRFGTFYLALLIGATFIAIRGTGLENHQRCPNDEEEVTYDNEPSASLNYAAGE